MFSYDNLKALLLALKEFQVIVDQNLGNPAISIATGCLGCNIEETHRRLIYAQIIKKKVTAVTATC